MILLTLQTHGACRLEHAHPSVDVDLLVLLAW